MNCQRRSSVSLFTLLVALGGCSAPEEDDLSTWMAKVQHEVVPAPAHEPSPIVVHEVTYDSASYLDPFDTGKITALVHASSGTSLQPDPHRPREPLESYPLDSLHMVGSLRRRGQAVALIKAEQTLYQVRKGHYLGQDQGKVTHISDDAIAIEETVQESAGTWTTRKVQLSIQGRK